MITRNDAEKFTVGFLLSSSTKGFQYVANSGIDESCFTDVHLKLLYEACISLNVKRKEANLLNVQIFLNEQDDNHFHLFGDGVLKTKERLTTLSQDVLKEYPSMKLQMNINTACTFLIDESKRREVYQKIIDISDALLSGKEIGEVLSKATSELLKIQSLFSNISAKSYLTLSDAINEKRKEIQDEIDGKTTNCFSTGFNQLDEILHGGLYAGRFVCIGAEAKHYKSTLAHSIGKHIATKNTPVGIISLEMKASEIAGRFAGLQYKSNPKERLNKLNEYAKDNQYLPLHFRQGGVSAKTMQSIALNLVNEKNCKVLIVDYLQLVQLNGKERTNEIDAFIASLKTLSLDLNIAVLLITALNTKSIGSRNTKKPTASDVRDTGRLIYDVDTLLLMWKPYEKNDSKYIETFICASRNGEDGRCAFRYDPLTLALVPEAISDKPIEQKQEKGNRDNIFSNSN